MMQHRVLCLLYIMCTNLSGKGLDMIVLAPYSILYILNNTYYLSFLINYDMWSPTYVMEKSLFMTIKTQNIKYLITFMFQPNSLSYKHDTRCFPMVGSYNYACFVHNVRRTCITEGLCHISTNTKSCECQVLNDCIWGGMFWCTYHESEGWAWYHPNMTGQIQLFNIWHESWFCFLSYILNTLV